MFGDYLVLVAQTIIHTLILYLLLQLLPLSVSVILYPILILSTREMFNFPGSQNNKTIENEDISVFLNDKSNRYGASDIDVEKTDSKSGILIPRLLGNHRILIPNDTNPEKLTNSAKVVISHELAHLHHYDALKSIASFVLFSILINILHVYMSTCLTLFGIFSLIVLFPIIFNFFSQRREYRADKFASEKTSVQSVILRISKNTHLCPQDGSLIYTHPSSAERTSKLYKTKNNK